MRFQNCIKMAQIVRIVCIFPALKATCFQFAVRPLLPACVCCFCHDTCIALTASCLYSPGKHLKRKIGLLIEEVKYSTFCNCIRGPSFDVSLILKNNIVWIKIPAESPFYILIGVLLSVAISMEQHDFTIQSGQMCNT